MTSEPQTAAPLSAEWLTIRQTHALPKDHPGYWSCVCGMAWPGEARAYPDDIRDHALFRVQAGEPGRDHDPGLARFRPDSREAATRARSGLDAGLRVFVEDLRRALVEGQRQWNSALTDTQPGTAYRTLERAVRVALDRLVQADAALASSGEAAPSGLDALRSDWPQHYTPDQAKAWIAAIDRAEGALASSGEAAPTIGKTGSICKCGAAKSYHGSRAPGRGIPDHEYDPRWSGEAAPADGLVICPLCKDPEREDDMVMGVCLTCADAIAFGQNARRGAVIVAGEAAPVDGLLDWPLYEHRDDPRCVCPACAVSSTSVAREEANDGR